MPESDLRLSLLENVEKSLKRTKGHAVLGSLVAGRWPLALAACVLHFRSRYSIQSIQHLAVRLLPSRDKHLLPNT